MKKKYEFTGETKEYCGVTLNRVVAVKDFGDVKKGDLGGWIEKESNLNHNENCWVFGEAMVYDEAQIFGNSQVHDNSQVSGKAKVYGESKLYGQVKIYGSARIFGNATVSGQTLVYGKSLMCGSASAYGDAEICDSANVYGEAQIIGGIIKGSSRVCGRAIVHAYAEVLGHFETLTKEVITISHPLHNITITDTHITIGCQNHPKEFWEKATYEDILEMDGKESAEAWVEFKPFILKLAGL